MTRENADDTDAVETIEEEKLIVGLTHSFLSIRIF